MTPEEIDRIARRRASAKMGWYLHATIFVLVNLAMYLGADWGWRAHPWNYRAALGWGVGLTMHWVSVFVLGRGSELRERLVERERERLRQRNQPGSQDR